VVGKRAIAGWLYCACGLVVAGCVLPVEILPTVLPNGIVGVFYSQTLTSDAGDSNVWEVSSGSLAPGLELDTSTGVLSGVPLTADSYSFTIGTTQFIRSGQRSYAMIVYPRLTLDATLNAARINTAYSDQFTVTGGLEPYTFAVVGLPAGLSLDPATGTVSGTPLSTYSAIQLLVTVTDSGNPQQSVTQQTFLKVKPPPVDITTTGPLPNGQVKQIYPDQQLTAVNGTPPYSWSAVSPAVGALPDGLELNLETGVIFGTPTAAGTFTFTITVTDSDSPETTDSQQFVIEILP